MTTTDFQDYFVVLSDIHMRDSSLYKQTDPRDYLHRVLRAITHHFGHARVCLLLGDLTDTGSNASYRYIRDQMQSIPMPVIATVGNHDNREIMQQYFSSSYNSDGFAQNSYKLGANQRLLVLDTKREGEASGELCYQRLHWLQNQLSSATEEHLIIAMHHPPAPLAVPAQDKIALINGDTLYRVLSAERQRIKMIICSHFHLSISASWHGLPVCALPALSYDHWSKARATSAFGLIAFNSSGQVVAHPVNF